MRRPGHPDCAADAVVRGSGGGFARESGVCARRTVPAPSVLRLPPDRADASDPCVGQGTPTTRQVRWCGAVVETSRGSGVCARRTALLRVPQSAVATYLSIAQTRVTPCVGQSTPTAQQVREWSHTCGLLTLRGRWWSAPALFRPDMPDGRLLWRWRGRPAPPYRRLRWSPMLPGR